MMFQGFSCGYFPVYIFKGIMNIVKSSEKLLGKCGLFHGIWKHFSCKNVTRGKELYVYVCVLIAIYLFWFLQCLHSTSRGHPMETVMDTQWKQLWIPNGNSYAYHAVFESACRLRTS